VYQFVSQSWQNADLAGTSQIIYPEVRPSSLLSKTGNYMPKHTQEKDDSIGELHIGRCDSGKVGNERKIKGRK
jgi:hypothetical protein